jgi:acetyl-CoA carboxylase carboxyltransferase component
LQGELDRLNEVNEDPGYQAAVYAMDQRQAHERAEEQRAATQRQNREERLFKERLQAHYEERFNHYRQARPGMPQEVFDGQIWPELARQFMAGQEDAVDRERRERSAPVF